MASKYEILTHINWLIGAPHGRGNYLYQYVINEMQSYKSSSIVFELNSFNTCIGYSGIFCQLGQFFKSFLNSSS